MSKCEVYKRQNVNTPEYVNVHMAECWTVTCQPVRMYACQGVTIQNFRVVSGSVDLIALSWARLACYIEQRARGAKKITKSQSIPL